MFSGKLSSGVEEEVIDVCKRAYRALNISSYIRFDIRINPEGKVFIIEPNANPCIAKIDEVAQSAQKVGMGYPQLIKKIVELALKSDSK